MRGKRPLCPPAGRKERIQGAEKRGQTAGRIHGTGSEGVGRAGEGHDAGQGICAACESVPPVSGRTGAGEQTMDRRMISVKRSLPREECLDAIKMTLIRFNAYMQELDSQHYYSPGKFTAEQRDFLYAMADRRYLENMNAVLMGGQLERLDDASLEKILDKCRKLSDGFGLYVDIPEGARIADGGEGHELDTYKKAKDGKDIWETVWGALQGKFNENLYHYNPVIKLTIEIAKAEIQIAGATYDFISQYQKMKDENIIGNDHYNHAMANSKATQRGKYGKMAAQILSFIREATDVLRKGDSDKDIREDNIANRYGRDIQPGESPEKHNAQFDTRQGGHRADLTGKASEESPKNVLKFLESYFTRDEYEK